MTNTTTKELVENINKYLEYFKEDTVLSVGDSYLVEAATLIQEQEKHIAELTEVQQETIKECAHIARTTMKKEKDAEEYTCSLCASQILKKLKENNHV